MKISKLTIIVLGALLVLGAIPGVQATVIQPIGLTPQQDHIVLARHGGGGGHWHGGGGHWHGGGGHWRGGGWGGGVIVAPSYYYGPAFRRICHFNYYGQYVCFRQYY